MLRDEYKKLLAFLEQTSVEQVKLEEILKEAVLFFEALRQEFPQASQEEREEMIQMMTHLHSKLQEVSKKTAQASGMTEDELSTFAENPSNFSPEQWQLVQATKRKLYDSARKFSSKLDEEHKKETPSDSTPKAAPKVIKSPMRRGSRKDWMKS